MRFRIEHSGESLVDEDSGILLRSSGNRILDNRLKDILFGIYFFGSNDNLVAVSPKSGRAVNAAEAEPYAGRLLPLPAFLREGGRGSWEEIAQGLDLTGHFLSRDLITERSRPLLESRRRLVDRLRRAGGLA